MRQRFVAWVVMVGICALDLSALARAEGPVGTNESIETYAMSVEQAQGANPAMEAMAPLAAAMEPQVNADVPPGGDPPVPVSEGGTGEDPKPKDPPLVVITDPEDGELIADGLYDVGGAFVDANFPPLLQDYASGIMNGNIPPMVDFLGENADGSISIEIGPGVGPNDLLIDFTMEIDGDTATVHIDLYPTSPGFGLPNNGADVQVTIQIDHGEEGGETITLNFPNLAETLLYFEEHFGGEGGVP